MSQLSRGERREAEKGQRKCEKQAQGEAARELRERQAALGLKPAPRATILNGKSEWPTVEAEQQARQEAVEEQLKVYRSLLPTLLKRLGKIRDPRNPKTLRHKLTVLILYGILAFVPHARDGLTAGSQPAPEPVRQLTDFSRICACCFRNWRACPSVDGTR